MDIIVIRHIAEGAAVFLAGQLKNYSKSAHTQIINAGNGTHEHPTQALLDAFSIKEKLGSIEGKKVVIVGDIMHSRVALSNIFSLQMLGADSEHSIILDQVENGLAVRMSILYLLDVK